VVRLTAPVFVDGTTPLNAATFNALGAEVDGKVILPGGAVTNGQWLKGSAGAVVWAAITPADIGGGYAPNKISVGTIAAGPPASPATNDIWIATDVGATGVCWQFRYNGASASAYKWEFIGGPSMEANAFGNADSLGVAFTLQTPSLTIARAGDYDVEVGADTFNNTSGATGWVMANTSTADPGLSAILTNAAAVNTMTVRLVFKQRLTGLSAAAVVAVYNRASAGTTRCNNRYLRVTPVRIS
jgi:hypothetical protein